MLQLSLLHKAGCTLYFLFCTLYYTSVQNKKLSLPVKEKNTAINIGSVNIYKTTSLSVEEMPTVLQNKTYCLESLNYFICQGFG